MTSAVLKRFWPKVEKRGDDECWLWLATKTAKGYGSMSLDGAERRAHVLSYEFYIGPVPPGHEVHHRCLNKLCVNPGHLIALTPEQHQAEHRTETCPHGHVFDEANTYSVPRTGARQCRECMRERQRARYWRARGGATA